MLIFLLLWQMHLVSSTIQTVIPPDPCQGIVNFLCHIQQFWYDDTVKEVEDKKDSGENRVKSWKMFVCVNQNFISTKKCRWMLKQSKDKPRRFCFLYVKKEKNGSKMKICQWNTVSLNKYPTGFTHSSLFLCSYAKQWK